MVSIKMFMRGIYNILFNSNLQKPLLYPFLYLVSYFGRVTKWPCGGLQILIRGFKSLPALLIFLGLTILILTSLKCSANIVINEVMYNPIQNDNYNEWIELYNPSNQSINVSGWSIFDNYAEDFIEADFENGNGTTIIPPYGYAIIADHETKIYENFSIPHNIIHLYVDDSSLGNGLGNSQDKLLLRNITGAEIDGIEWGYNYTDVTGMPIDLVDEGHSLARYKNIDSNNTSKDFYDGISPTPGSKNKFIQSPSLNIESYPLYIPKIHNNSEYGLPFAIKINISNYKSNETYELKSYVVGNISSSWPATQTWDGASWAYSNRYTSAITTDDNGNWSGWANIRLNKDYKEYQRNIKNDNTAFLNIKIKKEDNSTDEISKIVYLLDMDDSTSNSTKGGCIVGRIGKNNAYLEKHTIIVENKSGVTTGVYVTENNNIDDEFVSKPGYFKITSPIGTDYSLKVLDQNNIILHIIQNITIEQGEYGVEIYPPEIYYLLRKHETLDIPLTIKNTGDFYDTFDISINHVTDGWHAQLEQNKIPLNPMKTYDDYLHVKPNQQNGCKTGSVIISITSEKDIGKSDETTIQFEILAPDLTLLKIKNYSEYGEQTNIFREGEIAKIKAFLKNIGNENATNVSIMFYYDFKEQEHLIGSKHYSSVSKYQKYPSIQWDTTGVTPGDHTVFVIADKEKQIDELDELNNELSVKIKILDTSPSKKSERLLITEVYYHAHTRVNNEFITIYNPTNYTLNIAGWYLTNKPLKTRAGQTKTVFPNNTTILPYGCLYITQNASAYLWETGEKPDFEYSADSENIVPQMHVSKKFTLSNKGGTVALKDWYNHTIDLVVYGETDYNYKGWDGPPVPDSGAGVILKRNFDEKALPIDTNTSNDWKHPRRYGIGQSDFPYTNINFNGEIQTFVSPDNSFETIVNELQKANESIYFNIYEFTNPFLCDELVDALRRDVSVNIFLEGSPIGGISDKEKFILNRITSYGGNIRLIVNDRENDVYARYTFDHGKYLVIDNKTVIVESCNWAKTGIPKNPTYGNREWGIIIRNSDVARYFLSVFLDDWNQQRCDSYSYYDLDLFVSPNFFMDESIYTGHYKPEFESKTIKGNFSATPVFSPDTSYRAICDMIESAEESIYIEQLYIYKDWKNQISPFVERLVNKSLQGVNIKVILNYNPFYEATNDKCNLTKQFFEENNIEVKFIYTNWSYFTNVHNKGMIVDNKSVLIASINWNENSVTRNREAGIIIEHEEVAEYYAEVFFYDWNLKAPEDLQNNPSNENMNPNYENTIYIAVIFTLTFALIAQDWRKRKWT